jgi:post-segregation antitoxin (ccd killing protein)
LETQLSVPNPEAVTQTATASQISPPDGYKRLKVTRGKRVSLTPSQCASVEGQELLALLCEITRDGLVSKEGVQRLNTWLDGKSESDIPAISFLSNIPERFGELTTAKAFEVHFSIERVLPKTIRDGVKEKRQEAWLHSPLKPKATEAQLDYIRGLGGNPPPGLNIAEASLLIEQLLEHSGPTPKQNTTERQLQYIRDLGGNPSAELTHAAAAEIIQQLLARQQPTPRQMMILRFWNKTDLMQASKDEVAAWLEQFYNENPHRKAAWETFKLENGDDGSQHDPSSVPLGVGERYLNKTG